MPTYLFSNPDDPNDIIEVVQGINEKHEFQKDGKKWLREFVAPQAAVDSISNIDANDPKQFTTVTGRKRGKLGDIIDLSAELSQKRQEKLGQDPVKEKYFENYANKRKGRTHPEVRKRNAKEKLDKLGFELE